MILKGNMLKLTIPFFWAVQSIWLLSFKSIETFIAAIILLLISFLGIVIKSNTYNIIFLGICFLYSVALGQAAERDLRRNSRHQREHRPFQ